MSYNNGIISTPVSIYDVQQCLSTGENDLARLCTRSNINMWAAYKPIYSTVVGVLTEDDRKGAAHELEGFKTGGGLKKAVVTGAQYLGSTGSGGSVGDAVWTYDRPEADGECFFRLADFSGYWHTAPQSFAIGTIYGNIDNIIIPSSDLDAGATLGFTMTLKFRDGAISPSQLFGDCYELSGNIRDYFYPGVIMTCGGDSGLHYVKTADNRISSYMGNEDATVSLTIDTRTFMNAMKADWANKYSGQPYNNFPFRKGDKWTACMVLISRRFDESQGVHKLNGTESIVRLEYASPTGDVHVDRRTLPMRPSKYNNIEWMKVKVTIQNYTSDRSGYLAFKITSIVVTAKMLTADSASFKVNALLNTPQGSVVVSGYQESGQSSVHAEPYIGAKVYGGSVGEVVKTFTPGTDYTETTYYVPQNASAGNKLCNCYLTFVNVSTNDSFESRFSFDVNNTIYPEPIENEAL